ncbi:unnamed protein product, partial [Didymodactylos carnosus]
DKGITAKALHPGSITTPIQRHLTEEDAKLRASVFPGIDKIVRKTPQQDAATSVWAAVAPELEGIGGYYSEDVSFCDTEDSFQSPIQGTIPEAFNMKYAEQLWAISEKQVKLSQ